MSTGCASPEVTFIVPDLDIGSMAEAATDAVIEQVAEVMVTAAIGLGALGGGLLLARAAMAGTGLLADAAERAAQEQHRWAEESDAMRRRQRQWQDAVFAVARANARLDVLRARLAREVPRAGGPDVTGGPGGPDGRGPLPEPPDALDPVGMTLDEVHDWLAETDGAVRRVEAELAQRTLAAVPSGLRGASPVPRALTRRAKALADYARAPNERRAMGALPPYTPPPESITLTAERAAALGEELLAGLDPAVSAADCAYIQEQVGHAIELAEDRPAAAKLHVEAARDRWHDANWAAATRRDSAEWAALQLRFLRRPLPEGVEPPDLPGGMAADIATLEGVVERGDPLDPRRRARICERVHSLEAAITRGYVTRLVANEIAAADHGDGVRRREPAAGVTHLEWTPDGWGTEHWLRLVVDGQGTLRLVTVHRRRSKEEETREAMALDRRRCHEAAEHLARLTEAAAARGLRLDFAFATPDTVAVAGPGPAGESHDTQPITDHPVPRHRARGEDG